MQGPASKQIGIRVPAALGVRLQRVADAENNHVSAVTRRLLSKALDQEEAATRPPTETRPADALEV